MQLFYKPEIDQFTSGFFFEREESKHIIKVLRKKSGDILFVTDGKGTIYEAQITLASESKCTVSINNFTTSPPLKYHLHLAVAPTKMNERFEWFLEKATEFGVSEITPLLCERSERKIIKGDRMEKIIQSAMKQSLQSFLPVLNDAMSFTDFVNQERDGIQLIAHCEENQKRSLQDVAKQQAVVTILVGPEGDFSSKEIDLALKKGYLAVSLGNTRLRTETAAIAACHTIALLNE